MTTHPSIVNLHPAQARPSWQFPVGYAPLDQASPDGLGALYQGNLAVLTGGSQSGRTAAAVDATLAAAQKAAEHGLGPVLFAAVEDTAEQVLRRMRHQGAGEEVLSRVRIASVRTISELVGFVAQTASSAALGFPLERVPLVVPSMLVVDDLGLLHAELAERAGLTRQEAAAQIASMLAQLAHGGLGAAFHTSTGLNMSMVYGTPWLDLTPMVVLVTTRTRQDPKGISDLNDNALARFASLVCVVERGGAWSCLKSRYFRPE